MNTTPPPPPPLLRREALTAPSHAKRPKIRTHHGKQYLASMSMYNMNFLDREHDFRSLMIKTPPPKTPPPTTPTSFDNEISPLNWDLLSFRSVQQVDGQEESLSRKLTAGLLSAVNGNEGLG